jgi:hypothetical protein
MLALPTVPRNASEARAQSERPRYKRWGSAAKGIVEAGARKPRPIRVLLAEVPYLVRRGRPDVLTGARRKVVDHTLDFRLS